MPCLGERDVEHAVVVGVVLVGVQLRVRRDLNAALAVGPHGG